MFKCLVIPVYLVMFTSYSHGSLQLVTVSKGTFGGELGRLVTSSLETLLAQKEGLGPSIDACLDKISSQTNECVICIDNVSCDDSSLITTFLNTFETMNPTNYFPDVAQNVQNIVDSLASGVEAIYDIYGIEAINALQEGFGSLEHYGTVLGSGFNQAVDNAISSITNVANTAADIGSSVIDVGGDVGGTIIDFFGKRRRRRSTTSNIKLPELTPEQRQCLSQCPACAPFAAIESSSTAISTVTRHICGNQLTNDIETLQSKANKLKALVEVMQIQDVLLKEVWVDTAIAAVVLFEAWKSGVFQLYVPENTIDYDPFNQQPMYSAIAEVILNSY